MNRSIKEFDASRRYLFVARNGKSTTLSDLDSSLMSDSDIVVDLKTCRVLKNRDGVSSSSLEERYKMINESGLEFKDISHQKYRVYTFPGREHVRIDNPTHLNISASGGHRLLDASGKSHYVPFGWIHIEWESKEGCPNFVM